MKKHGSTNSALLFILALAMLLVGCSNNNINSHENNDMNHENVNPFEFDEKDMGALDAIGHGFVDPPLDENDERLPLYYKGAELAIDYYVNASGKAKNVGFLIFIDGEPQPYKFNETDAPYEYMHIIDVEEDDKDTPFTFIFTPVTGKQGETLDVNIVSVYNPSFIPDMKDTSAYGGYHSTLESLSSLVFEKDTEGLNTADIPAIDLMGNVRQSTEPITHELMEKHEKHSAMKVDLETLENIVIGEVSFNDDHALNIDNIQINDNGTLNITFKLFGYPGVEFRNTFFMNHKALSTSDGQTFFETTLTKGEVAVIDVELPLDRLEDFNTFYVVSVPQNTAEFPDGAFLQKSESILLYK